jgi:hypothetical protein
LRGETSRRGLCWATAIMMVAISRYVGAAHRGMRRRGRRPRLQPMLPLLLVLRLPELDVPRMCQLERPCLDLLSLAAWRLWA